MDILTYGYVKLLLPPGITGDYPLYLSHVAPTTLAGRYGSVPRPSSRMGA